MNNDHANCIINDPLVQTRLQTNNSTWRIINFSKQKSSKNSNEISKQETSNFFAHFLSRLWNGLDLLQ